MSKVFLFAGCLFLSVSGFGQTLSPYVTPAAGSFYLAGNASLSWSLGEPLTTTLQSGVLVLTQGEQQPTSLGLLPLVWLSVGGSLNRQKRAELRWEVSEQNVSQYFIVKKTVSTVDTLLGSLRSVGDGNHTYYWEENDPLIGQAQYRIKQIDKDGRYSYSPTVVLQNAEGNVWAYPNVVQSQTAIYTTDVLLLNTEALLTDITGQELKRIKMLPYVVVDLSGYRPGMYLLKLENGTCIKLIKAAP
jgi:hypothetical protein